LAREIQVGIIGATGYVGQELLRLLVQHPKAKIKVLASQSSAGKAYTSVYPSFRKFVDIECVQGDAEKLAKSVDVLLIALPHGLAAAHVSDELIKTTPVIDLGADFRLKDERAYEQWYGFKHPRPGLLKESVYGLCEFRRKELASARLIASPGCYATCSILALKPLIESKAIDPKTLVIDAKSGVSGAGRSLALGLHFDECNESIKAYKVGSHRHTPEIEQELSRHAPHPIVLTFTPHLVPMNRGILVTAYGALLSNFDEAAIRAVYENAYGNERFIRLFQPGVDDYEFPETRWVKGSNFCDIGFKIDARTNRLVVVAALDNLVKGAAGQAIQNLNILFGLDEATGLEQVPIFPG
jgi:N-acetyl-gamma-glutamyl-phosphate reductase